ncbi:hypothetical protein WS82_19565 [Burkholderia sp. MSMB2041]|nr:hypothetical protein WS82_19565 [Burkholderia sp. MSMB2041]
MLQPSVRMFDAPFDDAQIVMKTRVGRAAGAREPSLRRGLLVEARRVRLEPQERDDVLVLLDAECARGAICGP